MAGAVSASNSATSSLTGRSCTCLEVLDQRVQGAALSPRDSACSIRARLRGRPRGARGSGVPREESMRSGARPRSTRVRRARSRCMHAPPPLPRPRRGASRTRDAVVVDRLLFMLPSFSLPLSTAMASVAARRGCSSVVSRCDSRVVRVDPFVLLCAAPLQALLDRHGARLGRRSSCPLGSSRGVHAAGAPSIPLVVERLCDWVDVLTPRRYAASRRRGGRGAAAVVRVHGFGPHPAPPRPRFRPHRGVFNLWLPLIVPLRTRSYLRRLSAGTCTAGLAADAEASVVTIPS